MIRGELDAMLSRPRYGRRMSSRETGVSAGIAGHRHGSRTRTLIGTFGKTEIAVPRAGLSAADGETTEWKSEVLRACQRRTLAADALIASACLSGTDTRRVRLALNALFGGTVGKDMVSRVWRTVEERLGRQPEEEQVSVAALIMRAVARSYQTGSDEAA